MERNLKRARRALLLCSAISVAGIAAPAFAQDDQTSLPELVVTAERRVQNLQEVSIAATVISGEELIERGVTQIGDLQRVAPSLAINTYNRSTFVNIRGIGIAQSAPTSTPGVAFYLNGGLIPHEQTISQSFYDLESVQILRGPQGTLTGQNSTGGAIYVTTPKPVIGEFNGYVDGTVTDYNGVRAVAAANIPLTSWAAVRIAGIRDKRDSFTVNVGSPSQPGNVNMNAWRADLLVQPLERWTTNIRYEKYLNNNDYNAVKRRGDTVSTDPFIIQEDAISYFFQDGYRSEVESRFDLTDGIQVRADVNYQYGLNRDIGDGDRTNTAPVTAAGAARGRLGYTQTIFNTLISEVDLISTGEGPFQWVAGGFYLTETVPLVLFTYGNSRVNPDTAPTSTTRTKAHNLSRSAFGQANWEITPTVELVLGARYSKDTQIYERIAAPAPTGVARSSVTTGRAAVNWHFNDVTMFYGSVAKGYKAGGVNLVAGDAPFKPEENVVEEVGFKTTLYDGRLRLNGAAFASQYSNLQLSSLTPARLPTTANVPESKSHGAELEAEALLGPVRLNAGVAYLQAETDSVASILNNTLTPSVLQTVPVGSGLPFSPEWTFNAGIERDFEAFGGTITPRLQVSHLSEQYASIFRSAVTLVPDRTIWDARISYNSGGAWRAEVFANNLSDETYIASQVQNASSTNGGIIYGARRLVGVRFVVRAD